MLFCDPPPIAFSPLSYQPVAPSPFAISLNSALRWHPSVAATAASRSTCQRVNPPPPPQAAALHTSSAAYRSSTGRNNPISSGSKVFAARSQFGANLAALRAALSDAKEPNRWPFSRAVMSGKDSSNSSDIHSSSSSRHLMRYAPRHDPSQAGAENHDSPRSDTAASPLVTRREFTTHVAVTHVPPPPSQFAHGYALAPPPGTKMLVDPQTGQHYLVPTAQPPVAYYPVFYNPSQPPPPPSQPVYYQPTSAPGYLVASSLSSPPPTAHHQPIFFHQPPPATAAHFTTTTTTESRVPQDFSASFGASQKLTSGGYRVEIPPSAAPTPMSVDMQSGSPSRYFQRDHQYRISTESARSAGSQRNLSDDSMSPLPHPEASTPPSFNRMAAEQSSARYSTTSSSTSGFASGAGESTAEVSPMRRPCVRLQPRNPLYGAPAWWGDASPTEERRPALGEHDDRTPTESARDMRQSPPKMAMASPQLDRSSPPELRESPPQHRPYTSQPQSMAADGGSLKAPVQKSIRMDIDLSRPLSPEEKEKVCVKAAASRAPPTAFTVSFGDDDLKELKKANAVSLQDAARKAPTGRRLMRRSEPTKASTASAQAGDSGSESGQDPKHYLLNKMLQGYRRSGPPHPGNMSAPVLETIGVDEKPEIDTLSEAGTYVVDEKDRKSNAMVTSQTYAEDFESDAESSSSASSSSTETRSPPPSSSAPTSARSQPQQVAAQSSPKRSLMMDLQRLKAQCTTKPQPQPRRNAPPAWRNPSAEPRTSRATAAPPQQPTGRMCQQRPATSSTATSGNNNFRRGDGGRFSMRGGSAAASKPPPFRPLGASSSTKGPQRANFGNPPAKDSPEMTAWLRRKEYDPRKSAAEARKMQQFKDRANAYTSARSVTFHGGPGGASPFRSLRPQVDERSNKSHDDLSRLGEEPEELSHAGSTTSLTKTVDELTLKCQKSIQLLKLCNQNSLSASVENLLKRVMEPETAAVTAPAAADDNPMGSSDGLSENLSDRLDRLNSAFDAIQKYLEEQSAGGSTPPMPHRLLAAAVARPRVASAGAARSQSPSTPTATNSSGR